MTEHQVQRDANGIIDPTANVLALVEAAVKRLDDLHGAETLRGQDLQAAETRRVNDLLVEHDRYVGAEILHVKEVAELRAEHQREIGALESTRLNAIRQVDVLAVNTAADRAAAAIQALAATTAANAENLRNALNTTASTIAAQTANTVQAITERLAALEKSSYEGKGRQAYTDPAMADMLAEMRTLLTSKSITIGKSAGIGAVGGYLALVIGLIATVASIGLAVAHLVPK